MSLMSLSFSSGRWLICICVVLLLNVYARPKHLRHGLLPPLGDMIRQHLKTIDWPSAPVTDGGGGGAGAGRERGVVGGVPNVTFCNSTADPGTWIVYKFPILFHFPFCIFLFCVFCIFLILFAIFLQVTLGRHTTSRRKRTSK